MIASNEEVDGGDDRDWSLPGSFETTSSSNSALVADGDTVAFESIVKALVVGAAALTMGGVAAAGVAGIVLLGSNTSDLEERDSTGMAATDPAASESSAATLLSSPVQREVGAGAVPLDLLAGGTGASLILHAAEPPPVVVDSVNLVHTLNGHESIDSPTDPDRSVPAIDDDDTKHWLNNNTMISNDISPSSPIAAHSTDPITLAPPPHLQSGNDPVDISPSSPVTSSNFSKIDLQPPPRSPRFQAFADHEKELDREAVAAAGIGLAGFGAVGLTEIEKSRQGESSVMPPVGIADRASGDNAATSATRETARSETHDPLPVALSTGNDGSTIATPIDPTLPDTSSQPASISSVAPVSTLVDPSVAIVGSSAHSSSGKQSDTIAGEDSPSIEKGKGREQVDKGIAVGAAGLIGASVYDGSSDKADGIRNKSATTPLNPLSNAATDPTRSTQSSRFAEGLSPVDAHAPPSSQPAQTASSLPMIPHVSDFDTSTPDNTDRSDNLNTLAGLPPQRLQADLAHLSSASPDSTSGAASSDLASKNKVEGSLIGAGATVGAAGLAAEELYRHRANASATSKVKEPSATADLPPPISSGILPVAGGAALGAVAASSIDSSRDRSTPSPIRPDTAHIAATESSTVSPPVDDESVGKADQRRQEELVEALGVAGGAGVVDQRLQDHQRSQDRHLPEEMTTSSTHRAPPNKLHRAQHRTASVSSDAQSEIGRTSPSQEESLISSPSTEIRHSPHLGILSREDSVGHRRLVSGRVESNEVKPEADLEEFADFDEPSRIYARPTLATIESESVVPSASPRPRSQSISSPTTTSYPSSTTPGFMSSTPPSVDSSLSRSKSSLRKTRRSSHGSDGKRKSGFFSKLLHRDKDKRDAATEGETRSGASEGY